jgi:hypothetical protein
MRRTLYEIHTSKKHAYKRYTLMRCTSMRCTTLTYRILTYTLYEIQTCKRYTFLNWYISFVNVDPYRHKSLVLRNCRRSGLSRTCRTRSNAVLLDKKRTKLRREKVSGARRSKYRCGALAAKRPRPDRWDSATTWTSNSIENSIDVRPSYIA